MNKPLFVSALLIAILILVILPACNASSPELIPGYKVKKESHLNLSVENTPAALATDSLPEFSPTPVIWTATPLSITATQPPEVLATPSHTAMASPTLIPATDTVSPTLTPSSNSQMIKIYLVAVGDNGATGTKFGCDDSLVAVDVGIPPTTGVLRAALSELLAIKTATLGESGLYTALYQSDLEIDSLSVINGRASIYLKGDLILGGVCDAPRVEEQIKAIAFQFATVSAVDIFINGVPIDDVLSLQ